MPDSLFYQQSCAVYLLSCRVVSFNFSPVRHSNADGTQAEVGGMSRFPPHGQPN